MNERAKEARAMYHDVIGCIRANLEGSATEDEEIWPLSEDRQYLYDICLSTGGPGTGFLITANEEDEVLRLEYYRYEAGNSHTYWLDPDSDEYELVSRMWPYVAGHALDW